MKYDFAFVKNILENKIEILTLEHLGSGNHCDAFCINNNLVIKLPKNEKASKFLLNEIKVLNVINRKLSIEVPNVIMQGIFTHNDKNLNYFISKKVNGKNLNKKELNNLPSEVLEINAAIIATFLKQLHNEKSVFNIKRKDFVTLHGDFSLNHVLFNENNIVSGVLDFADSRIGKYKTDFIYLLDDDNEEFGKKFGLLILEKYKNL